jgi:hypothetical protein
VASVQKSLRIRRPGMGLDVFLERPPLKTSSESSPGERTEAGVARGRMQSSVAQGSGALRGWRRPGALEGSSLWSCRSQDRRPKSLQKSLPLFPSQVCVGTHSCHCPHNNTELDPSSLSLRHKKSSPQHHSWHLSSSCADLGLFILTQLRLDLGWDTCHPQVDRCVYSVHCGSTGSLQLCHN